MKTLAQKVDWLFDVHRSPQGKQFTYGHIQRATGGRITASYVWKLRTGAMSNPGLSALEALADFFRVPLDYFSQGGEYLEETIRLAHGLSHNGAGRQDALRKLTARADSLTDDHLRAVVELAEYLGAHEQPATAAQ